MDATCAQCGGAFDRPDGATGMVFSWCRECARSYGREWRRAHNPLKPCRDCGASYDRWQSWKNPGNAARRCRDCYNAHCRERQTPDPDGTRRRVVTPPRDPSTMTMKQIRNDARMKRLRREVFEQETHCGICGELVDKTLPHTSKMAGQIDHIIPLAFGGAPFDRDNVRLAHLSCNTSAGNRYRETVVVERLAFSRAALWLAERLAA